MNRRKNSDVTKCIKCLKIYSLDFIIKHSSILVSKNSIHKYFSAYIHPQLIFNPKKASKRCCTILSSLTIAILSISLFQAKQFFSRTLLYKAIDLVKSSSDLSNAQNLNKLERLHSPYKRWMINSFHPKVCVLFNVFL